MNLNISALGGVERSDNESHEGQRVRIIYSTPLTLPHRSYISPSRRWSLFRYNLQDKAKLLFRNGFVQSKQRNKKRGQWR
jgi:hypothetical protein